MVVDGPDGDEDVDVAVTNGQEMDKEENENAFFGCYLGALKVQISVWIF